MTVYKKIVVPVAQLSDCLEIKRNIKIALSEARLSEKKSEGQDIGSVEKIKEYEKDYDGENLVLRGEQMMDCGNVNNFGGLAGRVAWLSDGLGEAWRIWRESNL